MNQETPPKGFVRRDMFFVVAFFCLALGFAGGVITGTMYNPPRAAQQAMPGGMPGAMPGGVPGMPPQGMPGTMPPNMPPQSGQQAPRGPGALNPNERAKLLELEQAASKTPTSVEAKNQLGHFYFDHEMPAEAIKAYRASLDLKEAQPDIWTDMGVMLRETQNFEKALESFNRAIALNPKHEIARFNKGVVLVFDLERKADGVAAWKELLAINPNAKAPNGAPLAKLVEEVEKQ